MSHSRPRKTIALMIPWIGAKLHSNLGQEIFGGALEATTNADVDLLCLVGRQFAELTAGQANCVYEFATCDWVDGILAGSSFLSTLSGQEAAVTYLETFGKPLVHLNLAGGVGQQSPILDEDGIQQAVTHLVQVHGCRNILYVNGPPGDPTAEKRLAYFRLAIQKQHLPYDEAKTLSVAYDGVDWLGCCRETAREILAGRQLRPGTDFDAVVAYNDDIALAIIETFLEQGIAVPATIKVIGFDNSPLSRQCAVPLTSVDPDTRGQGRHGAHLLIGQLRIDQPANLVAPAPRLSIRQSCGCHEIADSYWRYAANKGSAAISPAGVRSSPRVQILSACLSWPETKILEQKDWMALYRAFLHCMKNVGSRNFFHLLEDLLFKAITRGSDIKVWHGLVQAIRTMVLAVLPPCYLSLAEELFQQARFVVSAACEWQKDFHFEQRIKNESILQSIEQELKNTFQIEGLLGILTRGIPRLGIVSCQIVLFENPGVYSWGDKLPDHSELIFDYHEGSASQAHSRFCTNTLLPIELIQTRHPRLRIVESLVFQNKRLGYIVFDPGRQNGDTIEFLSSQIASSLEGSNLVQSIVEKSKKLQEQLDELQQAQAHIIRSEKMAVIGRIVAGVAHEMGTPLGNALTAATFLKDLSHGLTEVINLGNLTKIQLKDFLARQEAGSVLVISNLARTTELVRLFKQVAIDQTSENQKVFNLTEYYRELCLNVKTLINKKNVTINLFAANNLVIDSFPGAFYQIFINLVVNSVTHGLKELPEVNINVELSKIGNDMIRITHSDNGVGMDAEGLKRLFEPFSPPRRTDGNLGLGTFIVYNYVTQLLGGVIRAESSPNEGLRIAFDIPCRIFK